MTLFSQKPKTSQTPQKSSEDFFGVQAKLSIGKSNDKYEVEADRVADQVVANKQNKSSDSFFSPSPLVQKKLANEVQKQDEKNEEIQTQEEVSKQQSSIGDATSNDTSRLENKLNSSKGRGTSLSGNTKKEMESGFRTDFSTIKIHTDSNAVQMNKQLGSQAFANGNNVYFNEGKYNPNSQSGKHLLAHELTHTVQQGASQPAVQAKMMPAENKPNPVAQPVVESKSVQKPETETKPTTEAKPENNIVKTPPANNKNENAGTGATTPNKTNPPVTVENAKPKEGQAIPAQDVNVAVQQGEAASLPVEAQPVEGAKENANPDANKVPTEAITSVDGAKPEEKPATDEKGAASKPNKADNKDKDVKAVDESAALAPKSPQEDPNFQKLAGRVGATAKGQKAHEKAEVSASSAQSAALSTDNERQSKAQAGQVDEMDGAPASEFSAEAFKAQLMARINSMQLPANQDEASDFKENNNIDEVSNAATQDVKKEKTAAVGPIEETANKEPNVAAIPEREIVPLPEAPIGDKPASVKPNQGMPPKRGDVEVNKPLEDNMAEVDQKMAENNITDEQLAKSNEPTFLEGLDSKAKAKENTEQAPQQLRNQEQGILGATNANANATGQLGLQNMHQDRDVLLNQVVGQQQETGTKDTAERTRIAGEINLIYEKTKTDVDALLATLDTDVSTLFNAGAETAKAKFENYVEQKMDAYKDDRYSGLIGKGRWIRDKFKGLPDEVNQFFVDGRQVYIDHMDGVITQIAQLVASKLTEAKTRITTGKQEVQDFVLALPDNLQNIGKEAADAITTKFDELEENVKGKQDELVESLAQQYMEGLKAVDARIEEMKAANRGLIDMVLDAVVGIIKTIISIVNMLTDLLLAALSAIGAIISDPIGFLSNLIDGVKLGFENFGSNILTHLTTGLVEWLTGSLGPMGIKIPADLFSLSGIFDLVAQILGVSWDYIRQKAIKMLGEPAVEALEKGFEVFVILKNEGIAGVWNYIKNEFGDLQVTIMDAIKDMVITKVIDAGIKWVLGLMNPAGAFIKAAMMIIDIVKFFMEKGSQIVELVHAFIDSIRAVASGSIGGVAKTIENALAKAIPVMIGFLASLLGITGLTEKVQKIIEKIRKRIDKAIDGLLLKAKNAFKKLVQSGKAILKGTTSKEGSNVPPVNDSTKDPNVDGAETSIDNESKALGANMPNIIGLEKKVNIDGGHSLKIEGNLKKIEINVYSSPKSLNNLLNEKRQEIHDKKTDPDYQNKSQSIQNLFNEKKLLGGNIGSYKRAVDNAYNVGHGNEPIKNAYELILTNLINISTDLAIVGITKHETELPVSHVVFDTDSKGRSYILRAAPLSKIPGNTRGSTPTQDPQGWNTIPVNLRSSGSWVRAHLLNHRLHGPGTENNLFPGTRDMNLRDMENQVESLAKTAVWDNNQVIYYNVDISYGNTGVFEDIPTIVSMSFGPYNTETKSRESATVTKRFTQNPPDVAARVTVNGSSSGSLNSRVLAEGGSNGIGLSGFFDRLIQGRPSGGYKNITQIKNIVSALYTDQNAFMKAFTKFNDLVNTNILEYD